MIFLNRDTLDSSSREAKDVINNVNDDVNQIVSAKNIVEKRKIHFFQSVFSSLREIKRDY